MKLEEGEKSAAGDGQQDDTITDSWHTYKIDVSRSLRKDTVILADRQLSFHIFFPMACRQEMIF